jgi:hypothetical protein
MKTNIQILQKKKGFALLGNHVVPEVLSPKYQRMFLNTINSNFAFTCVSCDKKPIFHSDNIIPCSFCECSFDLKDMVYRMIGTFALRTRLSTLRLISHFSNVHIEKFTGAVTFRLPSTVVGSLSGSGRKTAKTRSSS